MEAEAAKLIGAGLACTALIGAGIGIGNILGVISRALSGTPLPPTDNAPTFSSALPWRKPLVCLAWLLR